MKYSHIEAVDTNEELVSVVIEKLKSLHPECGDIEHVCEGGSDWAFDVYSKEDSEGVETLLQEYCITSSASGITILKLD